MTGRASLAHIDVITPARLKQLIFSYAVGSLHALSNRPPVFQLALYWFCFHNLNLT